MVEGLDFPSWLSPALDRYEHALVASLLDTRHLKDSFLQFFVIYNVVGQSVGSRSIVNFKVMVSHHGMCSVSLTLYFSGFPNQDFVEILGSFIDQLLATATAMKCGQQ